MGKFDFFFVLFSRIEPMLELSDLLTSKADFSVIFDEDRIVFSVINLESVWNKAFFSAPWLRKS